MNKSDLMEALSIKTGLTLYKAEEVVNTVFNDMADALVKGDRIELCGFGSFKIKKYKGYTGKTLKQVNRSRLSQKNCRFLNAARN